MKRFFNLLLGALAMLVVALTSAFIAMRLAIHGREVVVPNLAGLSITDAGHKAHSLGLSLNLENKFYSPDTPPGRVLAQSPAPGSKVRREWAVRITESLGAQQVSVPNLIGQSERAATINLRRLSLDLGSVAHIAAPGEPGIVLAQTPPPNAEGVDRPQVSLLLSEPEDSQPTSGVVMPSLIGLNLSSAYARATAAGLHVASIQSAPPTSTATSAPDSAPRPPTPPPVATTTPATAALPVSSPEVVVAQTPPAGHHVIKGEEVHLTLNQPATRFAIMSAASPSTDLPFQPSPVAPPYFDPEQATWTLSRHADVQAALREPTFLQASEKGVIEDVPDHSELYAKVQADISRLTATEWRTRMEHQLTRLIELLPHGQPFNLVDDVIQPWSVAMLLSLSEASPQAVQQLAEIANRLFIQYDKHTEAELDKMIESRQFTLSKSMFFGLTQTLPSFLASSWLALLQHPDQISKLLAEPNLITNATEELLRYAGIVNTLTRHATENVTIGTIHILKAQRLTLKLASANFDPAKFTHPYQLDITRRPAGQLGLGTGLHACVGAILVRSAFATITPLFLAAQPALASPHTIEWTGTHVRWPRTIPARLQRNT